MGSMKCLLSIAAKKDNYDYDAFYKQFVSLFHTKATKPAIVGKVATDTHPMRYMRTNATLSQFQEFFDFYGIKPANKKSSTF